jgi:hypothetical protein
VVRLGPIGVLGIYALGSTPIFLFFRFRGVINLIVALQRRAKGSSWLNPVSWVTPRGYTRDGFEDLTGFAGDVGKAMPVVAPWGLLLYLAGH